MKAQINKLMVAIDFSKYSDDTLRYAASLANSLGAQLIVANVVNQRDIAAMREFVQANSETNTEEYIAKEKANRSMKVQKLLEQVDCENLELKTVFRIGLPFFELIETIRANQTLASLSVVMLTGDPDPRHVKRALSLGVRRYMQKALDAYEFDEKMKALVSLCQTVRSERVS